MKRLWVVVIGVALSLSAWPCGSPRWPVKTGTDRDIEAVKPHPVPTTIDQLRKLVAPVDPTIRGDTRYAPTELTVYEVTGKLMVIDPKHDEDYHLVIADEHGRTFIAESPAPRCVKNSRFATQITAVRTAIDSAFGPIDRRKSINALVTVTGIGFFDYNHAGREGAAPNGIELHPILEIVFHPDKDLSALRHRLRNTPE